MKLCWQVARRESNPLLAPVQCTKLQGRSSQAKSVLKTGGGEVKFAEWIEQLTQRYADRDLLLNDTHFSLSLQLRITTTQQYPLNWLTTDKQTSKTWHHRPFPHTPLPFLYGRGERGGVRGVGKWVCNIVLLRKIPFHSPSTKFPLPPLFLPLTHFLKYFTVNASPRFRNCGCKCPYVLLQVKDDFHG